MIIQSVELVALPNAPAYQNKIYRAHLDTGEDIDLFQQHWDVQLPPESLVGRLVVGVVNFPPRQIGPMRSQCLVTGFHDTDGAVALCVPDRDVPLGTRLL